jgi:hypothetical protein
MTPSATTSSRAAVLARMELTTSSASSFRARERLRLSNFRHPLPSIRTLHRFASAQRHLTTVGRRAVFSSNDSDIDIGGHSIRRQRGQEAVVQLSDYSRPANGLRESFGASSTSSPKTGANMTSRSLLKASFPTRAKKNLGWNLTLQDLQHRGDHYLPRSGLLGRASTGIAFTRDRHRPQSAQLGTPLRRCPGCNRWIRVNKLGPRLFLNGGDRRGTRQVFFHDTQGPTGFNRAVDPVAEAPDTGASAL